MRSRAPSWASLNATTSVSGALRVTRARDPLQHPVDQGAAVPIQNLPRFSISNFSSCVFDVDTYHESRMEKGYSDGERVRSSQIDVYVSTSFPAVASTIGCPTRTASAWSPPLSVLWIS
ncbi:hypothetical protein DFQ26_001473 [Actinomortierella ambigua]|nr:hypothetical protein DFQ26_001473 [Actinomortierella ambigua]